MQLIAPRACEEFESRAPCGLLGPAPTDPPATAAAPVQRPLYVCNVCGRGQALCSCAQCGTALCETVPRILRDADALKHVTVTIGRFRSQGRRGPPVVRPAEDTRYLMPWEVPPVLKALRAARSAAADPRSVVVTSSMGVMHPRASSCRMTTSSLLRAGAAAVSDGRQCADQGTKR